MLGLVALHAECVQSEMRMRVLRARRAAVFGDEVKAAWECVLLRVLLFRAVVQLTCAVRSVLRDVAWPHNDPMCVHLYHRRAAPVGACMCEGSGRAVRGLHVLVIWPPQFGTPHVALLPQLGSVAVRL